MSDTSSHRNEPERAAIGALCQALGAAHERKDADAIIACYADDAVVYDLAPPLGRRGMNRTQLAAWLATWTGPIKVDIADSELAVGSDLGYISGLNRMRGTKVDGETIDLWFRSTLCFAKRDGQWRIVHDHSSVPFAMDGSFRACVDLTP